MQAAEVVKWPNIQRTPEQQAAFDRLVAELKAANESERLEPYKHCSVTVERRAKARHEHKDEEHRTSMRKHWNLPK